MSGTGNQGSSDSQATIPGVPLIDQGRPSGQPESQTSAGRLIEYDAATSQGKPSPRSWLW